MAHTSRHDDIAKLTQLTAFLDAAGRPAPYFGPFIERLRTARSEASRPGNQDPRALEALTRAATGAACRPMKDRARRFGREVLSSPDFKLREFFGQDWPTHVAPLDDSGGGSSWPVPFRPDLTSLSTYVDLARYATRDGRVTHCETYENTSTAKMGGYVRGLNTSPGDKEALRAHAESGFWWGYTPTRDCTIELRGTVVETYSRQYRELEDQWYQVSNCNVSQGNFLTTGFFFDDSSSIANYGKVMNPVGPGSTYSGDGENSDDFKDGWWDVTGVGNPDVDEVTRNGFRTLQFAYRPSARAVAGKPVYCFLGARAEFNATLDDVEATIRQGGTWRLTNLVIAEIT